MYPNCMKPKEYFEKINSPTRKKYEALKAFFLDNLPANEVAAKFGYEINSVYSMARDLNMQLTKHPHVDPFFIQPKKGRSFKKETPSIVSLIVALRKKNLSSPDIKSILDSQGQEVSERYITDVLKREGFARLPRRSKEHKGNRDIPDIPAPKSLSIDFSNETFSSSDIGILCFLPIIKYYGIDKIIKDSDYPETTIIDRFSSIMAFLALKLSNVRRYTADDLWCMDRGIGFFAGLNVLPKAAWFTSYSHRITKEMNLSFLRNLHQLWLEKNLFGDTINIDFTTIPYWGDDAHLEKNWSGKRRHSLSSMLAVLAQEPDSGIIDYGDADILHKNEDAVVLEFLDFYRDGKKDSNLKYLVFDSKFTCYENLAILDEKEIKFVTIRRRGKRIVEKIENIPTDKWKKIKVECAGNKKRTIRVNDDSIMLKGFKKEIRQIAITGHGKIKPALIITNDFELKTEDIVRKYTRRWLVEKSISEQIDFFHLNRVSSSMVVKVDFDLTMSITAHNLYRLIANDFNRYENLADNTIYEDFIKNSGDIEISDSEVKVFMKKKRALPIILSSMKFFENQSYSWMKNKKLMFYGATRT